MDKLELAIRIATEADVSGMDKTGDAAARMSDKVSKSSNDAERAARDYAGASDNLASKSGQATGGLGALAAGFELVGAEKYATSLQSASMATDFFSGVGDIANLVLESQAVANAKAALSAAKATVVTKAQAAATKTMTAVQWALNAAQSANPIGLIIIAIIALVALFVILYKRSDRFRELVQKVGKAGREALGWVVDKAGDLVGWFRDKLPQAASTMKDLLVRYITFITTPYRKLIGWSADLVGFFREKIPAGLRVLRDMAGGAIEKLTSPLQTAKDIAEDLYGWVKKILDKLPSIDLPSIPGLGKSSVVSSVGDTVGGWFNRSATMTAQAQPTAVFNLYDVLDPVAVAQKIEGLLTQHTRIFYGPVPA